MVDAQGVSNPSEEHVNALPRGQILLAVTLDLSNRTSQL